MELCKPLSKLNLSTLRQGSREKKNATEQMRNLTLANIRDLRLIRIKIQDLPTDIVAQLVEYRAISLGSNPCECQIFLICFVASFCLCYPGEALEGPISIGVCKIHQC